MGFGGIKKFYSCSHLTIIDAFRVYISLLDGNGDQSLQAKLSPELKPRYLRRLAGLRHAFRRIGNYRFDCIFAAVADVSIIRITSV